MIASEAQVWVATTPVDMRKSFDALAAVVLLDEPVAHLDSATARGVLDDLLAASADRTLVMVSHREDGRDGFARTLRLDPPGAVS